MRSCILVVTAVLTAGLFTGVSAAEVTIARNGESSYQIVLPDESGSESVDTALVAVAEIMQTAFATNGAELPIVRESQRAVNRPGIFLGDTAFARAAGLDVTTLDGWSYFHKVVGNDVIIAGLDVPTAISEAGGESIRQRWDRVGTAKAAADFLRQYAGVRFLYPDTGETLQQSAAMDLANSPSIEFLPTPVITVPADLDVMKHVQLYYNFWWRARGSITEIANNEFPLFNAAWSAHSHQLAVPVAEYYDSHPEYFALVGGNRFQGVQYCIANPGFQDRVYEYLVNLVERGYDSVYLGHSDAFRACQCELCYSYHDTGDDWTEKLWIFNREMAERLNESHPDATIVLTAYTLTERNAPQTFDSFPPNTMLMLCGTNEWDLAKWQDHDIPRGLTSYLYNRTPNQSSRYLPFNTPGFLADQVRRLNEANIRGIYNDGGLYRSGLEGPSAYVFGRMWDDPENGDPAALMLEFIEAAFGRSAAPMRRFYDQLYHQIELYSRYLGTRLQGWTYRDIYGRGRKHVTDLFQMVAFMYPPSILESLERELSQAEAAADNDRVRARLALVRREFDYVADLVRVIHLFHAHQIAPENQALFSELLDAIDLRNERIDGLYNERGHATTPHPLWRRVLFPPGGHAASHLRLERDGYQETVANTALNWNTAAMRDSIRPDRASAEVTPIPLGSSLSLDSEKWGQAPFLELHALPESEVAGNETTVRLLYDRDYLYIRFDCKWPPESAGQTAASGDFRQHQAVEVYLAPNPGEEVFYRFALAPDGSRFDAARGLITDDMNLLHGRDDPGWTGTWTGETVIAPDGQTWHAVMVIPFATLNSHPAASGNLWQANFMRTARDANGEQQQLVWSGITGLEDISTLGSLEFLQPTMRQRLQADRIRQNLSAIPDAWLQLPHPLPQQPEQWFFATDPMEVGRRDNWYAQDFDHSPWDTITVPAWYGETDLGIYHGYAWYRTTFDVPADWNGHTIRILFSGVDEQAWVYVNGNLVREHTVASEAMPIDVLYDRTFSAEIPPEAIRYGQPNTLTVRVHSSVGQGGIWRPVFIHRD